MINRLVHFNRTKRLVTSVMWLYVFACEGIAVDDSSSAKMQHPELEKIMSLPIQAHLCDIAGTGEVSETASNRFCIIVSNYWYGNPGSNTLCIAVSSDPSPMTNGPILFMASTNAYMQEEFVEPVGVLCRWSYLTNRVLSSSSEPTYPQPVPLSLLADKRSWAHTMEDGGALHAYVSNLVYSAKVSQNQQAFYEIVRDGANISTNVSPRIQEDSLLTLRQWAFYESEEYVAMMWSDPLIPAPVRAAIKFRFPHWE